MSLNHEYSHSYCSNFKQSPPLTSISMLLTSFLPNCFDCNYLTHRCLHSGIPPRPCFDPFSTYFLGSCFGSLASMGASSVEMTSPFLLQTFPTSSQILWTHQTSRLRMKYSIFYTYRECSPGKPGPSCTHSDRHRSPS